MTVHGTSVPKPTWDVPPTPETRRIGERMQLIRNADGSFAAPEVRPYQTDDGVIHHVVLVQDGQDRYVARFDQYAGRQAYALRDVLRERIHRVVSS